MRLTRSPFAGKRTAGAILLAVGTTACLPRERPVAAEWTRPGAIVRVWEPGGRTATGGTLVRLTPDSVRWRPDGAVAAERAAALRDVARLEVRAPRSQRAALRRGLVRGAAVGGLLGAVLLAVRPAAVGGAIGLTVGGAWVAGVVAGQQAEVARTPTVWRVVHPAPAS